MFLMFCCFMVMKHFDYGLCDASAFIMFSLFCYLQPLSLCPPSSIPCPPSITLSLCHSCSHPLSSITLSSFLSISLSSNSFPLHSILFLSSQYPFITPCLPILTLPTLHSVPCGYVSHFLHSLFAVLL